MEKGMRSITGLIPVLLLGLGVLGLVAFGGSAWAQSAPSSDKFIYHLNGDHDTDYNCTLEAKDLADGVLDGILGDCPAGTREATVNVGDSNSYEVHVTVSNPNGYSIDVKAQGGLAAGPRTTYSAIDVGGCGTATLTGLNSGKGSKAKTGNDPSQGNLITWTLSLAAPDAAGTVASCSLDVTVTKRYSSTGEQAVTSSWSALNVTDSLKSNYTGQLAVNVQ